MSGIKIGEVARRTGLTVRTLRHYEAIGLMPKAARNEGKQRLYGVAEIERLQQIVSLRQLGLRLDEIKAMLDRPAMAPRAALTWQLAHVEQQLAALTRLRDRLLLVTQSIRSGASPSLDELFATLEMMTMVEQQYTPEQLEWLANRRGEVGEERIKQVEAEWPVLIDEVAAAIDSGIAVDDPHVVALAARWRGLVHEFSGGKREIENAAQRVWDEQGDDLARTHGLNPRIRECAAFIERVG